MSARLGQDLAVPEALEFDVPCEECGEDASAWAVGMECCWMTTTKCIGCFARWETLVAVRLGRDVECHGCGHCGVLSWEWYRTVRF